MDLNLDESNISTLILSRTSSNKFGLIEQHFDQLLLRASKKPFAALTLTTF